MRYYATGRVLPERASVGFSRIQFAIDSGTVAIACDASQIAVTLDSLSSVDGWITARVQAELYARVIVSNLGFHKGCGYSVEIVQVTEENGVAHVFGVGVVGLAFAEGSRAFHRAFELSNRDLYFRLAVQDYVRALTEISDCATYCYRAIESIRSSFGPGDGSKPWADMHAALGTSRGLIDAVIKDFATPIRHGDWTEERPTNSQQRYDMLALTRTILSKYLDLRQPSLGSIRPPEEKATQGENA
jgi:hypothetical protein